MSFPPEKFIEKEQRQIFLRRMFRRVFLEDWGTKLIALGITLALWLGVTGLRSPVTQSYDHVALNLRSSNDMVITNTSAQDQEVTIFITGDKQQINKLNERNLIVSVDLTDAKSGDNVVQLTPETVNLDLPNGLKLDKIQPNKISVHLEKIAEQEVTVKPEIEGNLPDGFEIYSTNITPAKVRVRGAESVVKSLDSVSTDKINIENQKDNFTAAQVGLNVINPKITLLDTIVDVNFIIGEKRIERMFLIPVKYENNTKNVSVVLYGARSLMEKLKPEDLHIDLIKADNGTLSPQLTLPADLQDKIEIHKIKLAS